MILRAPREQVNAILGAMAAVALADGPAAVTPGDRVTIAAAGRVLFGLDEDVALESLTPRDPGALAAALPDEEAADPSWPRATRPSASCPTARSGGPSSTTSTATASPSPATPPAWPRGSPRRTTRAT